MLTTRSLEIFRTMGLPERVSACEEALAEIEMAADRPAAALPLLLRSNATFVEHGERAFQSTTQALLAQVYERLGNGDAARTAIDLAEKLGTTADVLTCAITHEVRARLALADGNPDAATRWAQSAVHQACATDSLTAQAQAKLNLARVLATIGRPHEATTAAEAALNLSNDKGDRPTAEQARALLDQLQSTVMPRT